jgi:hypothetical protein
MIERRCDHCGETYSAARPSSKFCGPTCRQRHRRNPELASQPSDDVATLVPTPAAGVYGATRAELDAADRAGTSLGAKALALAARIDSGMDTGSALAALVKQHDATMAEAVKGAQVSASPLDELRRRRDAKRATG